MGDEFTRAKHARLFDRFDDRTDGKLDEQVYIVCTTSRVHPHVKRTCFVLAWCGVWGVVCMSNNIDLQKEFKELAETLKMDEYDVRSL